MRYGHEGSKLGVIDFAISMDRLDHSQELDRELPVSRQTIKRAQMGTPKQAYLTVYALLIQKGSNGLKPLEMLPLTLQEIHQPKLQQHPDCKGHIGLGLIHVLA